MKNKQLYTNAKFVAIIAAICCFFWGSSYPAIKIGLVLFDISPDDIPSKFVFAGYRFAIAGIALLLVARAYGIKVFSLSLQSFRQLSILGVIQTTIHYAIFYIGVSNTSGTKGSIMNATTAFFGVVLAHYVYKNDKLSRGKVLGSMIGFLGVVIVNFSADLLNFTFRFTGEGFVIVAAFIFSAVGLYAKKLTKTLDVVLITSYSLLIGGIALTVIGIAFGGKVNHFTWESSSLLMFLAVSSSASFYLWNWLLKYNKVGRVSVYNFLVPVFGVTLSSIFLGEAILEIKNLLALVLVSLGIWLVNKEDT
ncbi:DMT family transporter [Paenibacillus hexagrammi]|uniref:DMT family transporter n=1 Tax=Paenibacillus hexagrammi TaxID=2908839 RepID=A0ABY3SIY0_9BACL|nr:DMT family transporter [Paenibacillus sp. YPD9-1]UJF33448.1 DMT family transporter [Paenibacillus sp. YPD9-1]